MSVRSEPNQHILKFPNDTVLLSLLTKKSNYSTHSAGEQDLVAWCDEHKLQIKHSNTVEMVTDPRPGGDHGPVTIHSHVIKQVSSRKYLVLRIDSDLNWHTQVTTVCSRIHQRLGVLSLFYCAF